MSNAPTMLAAIYPSRDQAKTIFDVLESMRRGVNLDLEDAAIVTKDPDGKIRVEETKDLTAKKGARRGALIAGAFAVIFPPSLIASAVVGGAAGALAGRSRDTGIKGGEMQTLAEQLGPAQAMLVVLAESEYLVKIQNAMSAESGELVVTAFDEETLKAINIEQIKQDSTGLH